MVLAGSYRRFSVLTILATLGIVLASLYVLLMYQRTMTGPGVAVGGTMTDLSIREKFVMAPVIAVILALGFFPGAGPRRDQPGGHRDARPRRGDRP